VTDSKSKEAILILGMHRSGTSALAGTMGHLGFEMGHEFVETDIRINAKGYWENSDSTILDQELLVHLGSNWFDVLDLPEGWIQRCESTEFENRLIGIIDAQFGDLKQWAIKDPRLCRLLPFWIGTLDRVHTAAKCLVIVRHPFEVCQSLRKRDGIDEPYALLLWLRYILDCEFHSRVVKRSFMTYRDLLSDWRQTLQLSFNQTGLKFPHLTPSEEQGISAFVDKKLMHHSEENLSVTSPLMSLAVKCYRSIEAGDFSEFDAFRDAFDSILSDNLALVNQTKISLEQQDVYRKQIQRLLHEKNHLRKLLDEIESSLGWRTLNFFRRARGFGNPDGSDSV